MRTSQTLRIAAPFTLIACWTAVFLLIQTPSSRAEETIPLGALDLHKVMQGWGSPRADKSVDSHPLTIGGKKFEKGLGTHAESIFYIDLQGGAKRFNRCGRRG